jgi:hypothetical protein
VAGKVPDKELSCALLRRKHEWVADDEEDEGTYNVDIFDRFPISEGNVPER